MMQPHALSAQGCQVPPDLIVVARTLAALPADGTALPPALADRLSQQMAQLSESAILRDLTDAGLESLSPIAVDLLAEAERLANGGSSYSSGRIQRVLSELDQQSVLACVDDGKSIFQKIQQGRDGGFFTEEGGGWSELEKRVQEEKLFAAGAVLAAMAGFISILVLLDAGYRWIMALLYNRKACRIAANLHVRDKVVDGLIITLGKGGCRFHPLNMVAFDEALPDLRGAPATLIVEDQELSVWSSGIYDTVTDFRFDKPITLKHQRALLEHSTISPYYIRRTRERGDSATEHLIG